MHAPTRLWFLPLLLLALCAGSAEAKDLVATDTKLVRDAHESGEDLKKLVSKLRVDPFILVEHLCGNGAGEAAAALAAALESLRPYKELPAFVQWRRGHPTTPAERAHWQEFVGLWRAKDLPGALAVIETGKSVGGGVQQARLQRMRAKIVFWLKKTDAARLPAHRAAGEACIQVGWWAGALAELGPAVAVAARLGRSADVVAIAELAIPVAAALGRRSDLRGAHTRAAHAHRALGHHDEAILHAEAAWRNSEAPQEQRLALKYLVMLEIGGQRRHAVLRHLPMMQKLNEQFGTPADIAASNVQLASLEATRGNLNAALVRIQDAIAYFEEHGRPGDRRGAHMHAANIWLQILDGQRSREHVRLARAAGKGLGYNDSTLYMLDGWAHSLDGNPAAAAASFAKALPLVQAGPVPSRVSLRTALAEMLGQDNRLEEAEKHLAAARALVASASVVPPGTHTDLALAESRQRTWTGDHEGALALAKRARSYRVPGLFEAGDVLVELRIAHAHTALGQAAQALAAARLAAAMVVERSMSLPDEVGSQHRANAAEIFFLGIEAAGVGDDPDALFEMAEQERAVALRARLDAGAIRRSSVEPALRAEEADLVESEALAVAQYRRAIGSEDDAAARAAFGALGGVRKKLERHRERVRARHAVAGQVLSPVVDGLAAARADLAKDEVLVVYAMGDPHIWALVVTHDGARVERLGTHQQVGAAIATAVSEDPSVSARHAAATLTKMIVAPLKLPRETRRIRLLPAGRIAWIPFALVVLAPAVEHDRSLQP